MSRYKVVVTRNIGPDALGIIRACNDIDMVLWNHDERPEREWVLQNAQGAHGLLVLMSDKVNDELLDAAGISLPS